MNSCVVISVSEPKVYEDGVVVININLEESDPSDISHKLDAVLQDDFLVC